MSSAINIHNIKKTHKPAIRQQACVSYENDEARNSCVDKRMRAIYPALPAYRFFVSCSSSGASSISSVKLALVMEPD